LRQAGPSGVRAVATYYQARVTLDPHTAPLAIGMHGQAKILVAPEPLFALLLRYLQLTFRL
jgi:hypothetical protein